MNRHQRRADQAAFKREVFHAGLLTHLFDARTPLEDRPLLHYAAQFGSGETASQRRTPRCFGCADRVGVDRQPTGLLSLARVLAGCSRPHDNACKSSGVQTLWVGGKSQIIGAKEQGPKRACGCALAYMYCTRIWSADMFCDGEAQRCVGRKGA